MLPDRTPKRDILWTPFIFFFYRDILRVFKIKIQTIFSPLVSKFLYLLVFGVSLGQVVQISDQFSYLQFIIPGLITMAMLNQSFINGSSSVFSMKITGEIIYVKSTALNIQQIIFGVAFSGLIRGIIVSFLTFVLAAGFHLYFEAYFMPIHSLIWLPVFLILGGLIFALIGFSVGIWSKSFDHVEAITSVVIGPLIYLGGLFFDLDTLSPFWQKVAMFNPLLYFIDGVRYSFLGVADTSVFHAFYVICFSLLVSYGVALVSALTGTFQRSS